MKLFAIAVVATAALLSVGCQNGFRVESNLNPKNFSEYAKPASVEVYTEDSILEHRYHSLGMVAGLACQEKADDYIATEADARTDAKIKTADLGGNGVVFGKCIRLERTDACYVSVTCYGEAFKVDDSFKNQGK